MLFKKYKITFIRELSAVVDAVEAESFFYIILEKFHDLKRIDLALQPNLELSQFELEKWEAIVAELKTQKPIQYILGETEFYGLPFLVNKNTLIPRPETEELVDLIIKDVNCYKELRQAQFDNSAKLNILDIGTGSGCIAISLAKNIENTQVFAIDVSEDALKIAKKNAEINEVEIIFNCENILEIVFLSAVEGFPTKFDIIVSNPPYVRNLEKDEIKENVLAFEPHLALFVDDTDALLFYRKIALLAKESLTENGRLYFEINQYLGLETVELLKGLGFRDVILMQDIYGNNRMISCKK
ncbi:peptide chain release factor N(5)-glutamine methyltransferase [Flavobacterium sp.]|uniref:peptide chain release factor N(5)-glutamine methyltransferase n=1 Tax=Flavobacterium sp. TaxID=239 RepID=UPI003750C98B